MPDTKKRLILLYDLALADKDITDHADTISDYTYLANEFAAQGIVIECLHDLDVVIEEDIDEEIRMSLRNAKKFIVGLDIEIRADEIDAALEILNDFSIDDDEELVEDDILNKVRPVNFDADDIVTCTLLEDIEHVAPESSLDDDDDDDDDDISEEV